MNLEKLDFLFKYEPIATIALVLLVTATAVAICVAAYIAACTAWETLAEKRSERRADPATERVEPT